MEIAVSKPRKLNLKSTWRFPTQGSPTPCITNLFWNWYEEDNSLIGGFFQIKGGFFLLLHSFPEHLELETVIPVVIF